VSFDLLVEGERAFRREYAGELSVEVFIVNGINSQISDVRKIAELVRSLNPDRIDLNTAIRPPADSGVKAVSEKQLAELAKVFGPKAEVTASAKKQESQVLDVSEESLLGLIKRHPATCAQLAKEFNQPEDRIFGMLKEMASTGLLLAELRGEETYYFHRTD